MKLVPHLVATVLAVVKAFLAIVDSVRTISCKTVTWSISCKTVARSWANWINSGTLPWTLRDSGTISWKTVTRTISGETVTRTISDETVARFWANWINSGTLLGNSRTLPWPRVRIAIVQELGRRSACHNTSTDTGTDTNTGGGPSG